MPTAETHIPSHNAQVKGATEAIVCHPNAAYKLSCFYDGHVPRAELDHAIAIDKAFRDRHPEWFGMSENARYAREARVQMRDLIVSLRAVGATAGKLSKRNADNIQYLRNIFRSHHRLALAEACLTHGQVS